MIESKQLEMEGKKEMKQTYYLMNFCMYNQSDIELFCLYKQFVENTIIELGEDWRIQSGLLSQQIISIFQNGMAAEANASMPERLQFNIFNEFLQPFLKHKIGYEKQVVTLSDTVIQDKFSEQLASHFSFNTKIISSLTFKTLSLGFCIKATDMWMKNFSTISQNNNKDNTEFILTPLGILSKQTTNKYIAIFGEKNSSVGASTIRNNLSNIDLASCHHSNSEMQVLTKKNIKPIIQKKWIQLKNLNNFTNQQIKGIIHSIKKTSFKKIQVISNFVTNIHQINTDTKKVRVISINHKFYCIAFIVWLIFNIKLFFSITFEQYLVYFKYLMENWDQNLEPALKKFYSVIQKQWNLLLKDYSVALHDDLEVLKSLVKRVRLSYEQSWKMKHQQIQKKLSD